MSASREKKLRQELAAQGITDPKKIREAEEKAAARKNNILYGTIAGVFALVAVALLVFNSGILQRDIAAVTIDGEKYSSAYVEYFYTNIEYNIVNGGYASYYGVDTSVSLDQQTVSDSAKTLLGVEDEGEITWDQFIRDMAVEQLAQVVMCAKESEAGDSHDDHHDTAAEVEATMEEVAGYAQQNGYSTKDYLKLIYGKFMTPEIFEDLIGMVETASHYQSHYQADLTYTVDELEAFYQEDPSLFDVADYEYLYFRGTADSTTDADGNTVEPTDEENEAAKAQAKADAAAVLERVQAGESLKDVSADYENASYNTLEAASNSGSSIAEWVFDDSRQAGDSAVVDVDPNCYVVVFHSVGRQEYATVDVRHILFKVDTDELDSESETYEDDLQAAKDAAKQEAEDALAQWKAGDATEDSFAALAVEFSEDSGSASEGGLYTQVYKDQMVDAFNDWCFDESRQAGDTGIVLGEGYYYTGYHVMYFVGDNIPYWQVETDSALRERDLDNWLDSLVTAADVTLERGMKYVG